MIKTLVHLKLRESDSDYIKILCSKRKCEGFDLITISIKPNLSPLEHIKNIFKIIYFLFNEKTVFLVHDSRSIYSLVLNILLSPKKVVVSSDGLIDSFKEINNFNVRYRLVRTLPKKIIYYLLYTIYKIKCALLGEQLFGNLLTLYDKFLFYGDIKEKRGGHGVFIGQPLSELGIITLDDELKRLSKIKYYYTHPRDSIKKVNLLVSQGTKIVEKNNKSIEERIANGEFSHVCGFYSSTLFFTNFFDLLEVNVIPLELSTDIPKHMKDEIEDSYKVLI